MPPPDSPGPALSPAGLGQIGELLAALDRLDPILHLPVSPGPGDPGLAFGRYTLRRRIGVGRFGVAVLADDPGLGRQVVVKVPQPAVLTDPAARGRFVREARAAARLDHPGIVPVFEAGEAGGLPYLVAGYVDGPTLADWLRDRPGPVPAAAAAGLVGRLAAAVHHAHERGVLHCDLSPANVLLTAGPDPHPVITDFGLARLAEDDPSLSHSFQVAGTPLYMSPEQARGDRRNLTARADVYALGAILYELLVGRPPFAEGSAAEVVRRVLEAAPVPPRRANPAVPPDLDAVCRKCLEKDPARRYGNAAELAADLDRFRAGRPTLARPVGPAAAAWRAARRRPLVAGLAVTAALALAAVPAVATWYSLRLEEEAAARRHAEREADRDRELADAREFYAVLERVHRRRAEAGHGWAAANRADVARLAGMRSAAGEAATLRTEAAVALAGFDLPDPRAVAVGFKAHVPAFSADGRRLALGGWHSFDGRVWEVRLLDPATGAAAGRLTHPIDREWCARRGNPNADGVRAVAFSPDGRWLATGTRSGWVVWWDLAAPDRPPVARRHGPAQANTGDDRVIGLAFAAGGRLLVSAGGPDLVAWDAAAGWAEAGREAGRPSELAVLARPARAGDPLFGWAGGRGAARVAADPPVFRLAPLVGWGAVAAGGPGGRSVAAAREGRLDLQDAATGTPAGALTLPGDDRAEDGAITDAAVSPDGRLLAVAAEHDDHLKVWDLPSGRLAAARNLGNQGSGSLRLAFAPDGRTLAVCETDRTLLYDLPALRVAEPVAAQHFPVRDADQSPDGAAVVTWAAVVVRPNHPVEVSVWAAGGSDPVWRSAHTFAPGARNRPLVAYDPAGRTVVETTGDGVKFSGLAAGSPGGWLTVGSSDAFHSAKDLRFDPAGRLWGCVNGRLARWAGVGSPATFAPDPGAGAGSGLPVCVTPGGTTVAVGRADGTVTFHPPDGGPPAAKPVFPVGVAAVGLAPDGRSAVAGSVDGEVAVLRVAAGEPVVRLPAAHGDDVTAVAVGPGGWFATGSADRAVKVWAPDGRLVLTLPQTRPVRRLFWSADGRTLTILAEGERGLRRWHLDRLRDEFLALGLAPGLPPPR